MCARFSLRISDADFARQYGIDLDCAVIDLPEIFPTEGVPVVFTHPKEGKRRLETMRWGLIPSWADDIKVGQKMINARVETLTQLPAFREAFQRRRCLLPATAFYEWHDKQRYAVTLPNGEAFAMGGLWESWKNRASGEWLRSCTIITTDANSIIAPLHDRMPLVIPKSAYEQWLDPSDVPPPQLLEPLPAELTLVTPVGKQVRPTQVSLFE